MVLKVAAPLADTNGVGRAVRDVGDADTAIAVEYPVERLILVAAVQRVGVARVPPAKQPT